MALLAQMLLWQDSGVRLVEMPDSWRLLFFTGYGGSLAGFAWCIKVLGQVDSFGIDGMVAKLKGRKSPAPAFVVRGPYRWVRHPIYFLTS